MCRNSKNKKLLEELKPYDDLCEKIRKEYNFQFLVYPPKGIYLTGYENCKDVNLWTYWQGRGVVHPTIMVLGQDWGSIHHKGDEELAEKVAKIHSQDLDIDIDDKEIMHEKDAAIDMWDGKRTDTDNNLRILFNSLNLGYDDIYKKRYKDLFFTNLCLGYRCGKNYGDKVPISGYFDQETWLTSVEKKYFKELIDMLNPKIIICLGQQTYDGLMSIIKMKDPRYEKLKYCAFIDVNTVKPGLYNKSAIFAVSHTGDKGLWNYNNYYNKNHDGKVAYNEISTLMNYWKNIANYIIKLRVENSQDVEKLVEINEPIINFDNSSHKKKNNSSKQTRVYQIKSQKKMTVNKVPKTTNLKANYYKASDATKSQVNAFAAQLGNNDELIKWAKSKGLVWTEYENQAQNIMRLKMALQEAFDKGEIELK